MWQQTTNKIPDGHMEEKNMARRKIIAGNWKMNKTPSETVKLIEELKPLVNNEDVDVVFCVPAISLTTALEAAKGRGEYVLRGERCLHR